MTKEEVKELLMDKFDVKETIEEWKISWHKLYYINYIKKNIHIKLNWSTYTEKEFWKNTDNFYIHFYCKGYDLSRQIKEVILNWNKYFLAWAEDSKVLVSEDWKIIRVIHTYEANNVYVWRWFIVIWGYDYCHIVYEDKEEELPLR